MWGQQQPKMPHVHTAKCVPRRRQSRKRLVIQFVVASSARQTTRQKRTNMQHKKLEAMSAEAVRASLVKRNLVKPTSTAPAHVLREIASGIFIDGDKTD
jgi:hypothetical protein